MAPRAKAKKKNTKKKQVVRKATKKSSGKKTAKKATKKASKKTAKKSAKKKIIKKTSTKKASSKKTTSKVAKRKISPKKKAAARNTTKKTKKLTTGKVSKKMKKTPTKGANKKSSSNVLGRGLSALMSANAVRVEPKAYKSYAASVPSPEALQKSISREQAYSFNKEENANGLMFLDVTDVKANPNQPRKEFSHQDLQELSDSIKKSGLLQPILVTKKAENSYEIVAGERRFRASQLAGITKIPALIRELNEREILELSIVENVQRTDLNPVEEALAYQRLADEFLSLIHI